MCGRFALHHSVDEVVNRFQIQEVLFEFPARYNIAPSQPVAAITQNGARRLNAFQWGLVPRWAKDPSIGNRLINARAETLAEKPAFKSALKRRRCLIPADGFYEWQAQGKAKQPLHIHRADGALFAFAGLWEEWDAPDGSPLQTCTIVTGEPNELLRQVHHRMAVILRPDDEAAWLDPDLQDVPELMQILAPREDKALGMYPVSKRVNSPVYDAPDCITPATREDAAPTLF